MNVEFPIKNLQTERIYHKNDRRIELKFMLSKSLADTVRLWAFENMDADPYCDSELANSYQINTLYLDTMDLDICYKTKKLGSVKHRLRRYADENTVWLETKSKSKNIVCKNRTAVSLIELDRLNLPIENGQKWSEKCWSGEWFQKRVQELGLQPAAMIHYQRFARTKQYQNQNLRLTIDSELVGRRVGKLEVTHPNGTEIELFSTGEILELKFHNILPPLFKRLLLEIPMVSSGFSKYRTTIERSNLLNSLPNPTLLNFI